MNAELFGRFTSDVAQAAKAEAKEEASKERLEIMVARFGKLRLGEPPVQAITLEQALNYLQGLATDDVKTLSTLSDQELINLLRASLAVDGDRQPARTPGDLNVLPAGQDNHEPSQDSEPPPVPGQG